MRIEKLVKTIYNRKWNHTILRLNLEIRNEIKCCFIITHVFIDINIHIQAYTVQLIEWTLQFQRKLIITNICVHTNIWLVTKRFFLNILTRHLTNFQVWKWIARSRVNRYPDLHINMIEKSHQFPIEIHPKKSV